MEILNETVYNSFDLHFLILAVHNWCGIRNTEMRDATRIQHKANGQPFDESKSYWQNSPLPAKFQIGYYSRKKDGNWASLQGRYRSECPRLGIPRLEQMPIAVMSVLAESATQDSSQEEGLPRKQKIALIRKIQECFRGGLKEEDYEELAETIKVRFTRDVGKLAAKEASRQGRVARLQQKLGHANSVVANIQTKLGEAIVERDALIEKIHKLDPSAGMRLCV